MRRHFGPDQPVRKFSAVGASRAPGGCGLPGGGGAKEPAGPCQHGAGPKAGHGEGVTAPSPPFLGAFSGSPPFPNVFLSSWRLPLLSHLLRPVSALLRKAHFVHVLSQGLAGSRRIIHAAVFGPKLAASCPLRLQEESWSWAGASSRVTWCTFSVPCPHIHVGQHSKVFSSLGPSCRCSPSQCLCTQLPAPSRTPTVQREALQWLLGSGCGGKGTPHIAVPPSCSQKGFEKAIP